jgi:hypothetical protein
VQQDATIQDQFITFDVEMMLHHLHFRLYTLGRLACFDSALVLIQRIAQILGATDSTKLSNFLCTYVTKVWVATYAAF